MTSLFLSYLSKAINRYLQLDPESQRRLRSLNGKVASIELLPLHFTFQLHFTESEILIKENEIATPDTVIRGTPLQMLGMMLAKNRQQFFADDVSIEGSAELGQQIIELFDDMQIDWEEYLSQLTGDKPAHHAGKIIRRIGNWLHRSKDTFRQNVTDYVHEEKLWFPTKEALQDFFSDIDTLRMDVDRIDARISLLSSTLNDKKDKP